MPKGFGFKERVIHKVSELPPIDKVLQKRAEWFTKETGIERYLKKDGQYMDVGTGKGHITQQIMASMAKAGNPLKAFYGIDIADKPLHKVQRREAERLRSQGTSSISKENPMGFVWASSEALPFRDKSLDGVSCIFSIHHMSKEKVDEVMAELKRVIKIDGNIFIAEDLVESPEQREITEKIDRKLNFESADKEHNYKSDEEWAEYFRELGLEVIERRFFESKSKDGVVHHGFYALKLAHPEG